jgi:probable F420-dependent oxidoreductase
VGVVNARVGLLLPSRDAVALGRPAQTIVDMAVEAEAAGYDSIWLGESVVARPRYDPMVMLAAIAMRTERIAMGTAVVVAPLRHPVQLAQVVASVDQLTSGRVILGVGAGPAYGPSRKEYATVGVPFERRFSRLREGVQLCRLLWQGEPVSFDGEFYQVRNVDLGPKPFQAGGPPVWLGAKGEAGRRMAGAVFDGWFPGPESPEWFAEGLADVRVAAVDAARDPRSVTSAVYVTVSVCADGEAGRQSSREAIERYYRQPYEAVASLHDSFLGPAPAAAGWLARYVAAGAGHLVIRLLGEDPQTQMRELAPYLSDIRGPLPAPNDLKRACIHAPSNGNLHAEWHPRLANEDIDERSGI